MITRLVSSLALVATLFAAVFSHAQQPSYDFIITGARIVDGTGAPWFVGDIGIVGDRIAAIGDLQYAAAKKRVEAAGLVASPGFIDVQGQSEFNVLVDGRAASGLPVVLDKAELLVHGAADPDAVVAGNAADLDERVEAGPGG